MRKALQAVVILLLFMLPWVLVLLVRPTEPVPQWCEVPYRIQNEGTPVGAIDAVLRNRFNANGSGASTLAGTVTVGDRHYRLHRIAQSQWHRQGDFMMVTTRSVRIMADDTVPPVLASHILFSSLREGNTDYYQMYQLPNGDQVVNFSGMPRLYCHT